MLHQAVDPETLKFMGAKDVNTENYTDMKRYIETRYLEELGCKPLHAEKKGLNTVDESQNDEWDEWGSWRHDSLDLSYAGKSKGKGNNGKGKNSNSKGKPI